MCLTYLLTLIDSIYKSDKSCYPRRHLEECKCIVKDEEVRRSIAKV